MKWTECLGLVALGFPCSLTTPAQAPHALQNPNLPVEQRITDLLASMTLDEKIAVLGTTTAVPRLGVPEAGRSEGLHGPVQHSLGGLGNQKITVTTQFAQVVGMAQTWDPDLIRRAGEVQATEARWIANHKENPVAPPLVIWGPNADLRSIRVGAASTSRMERMRSSPGPWRAHSSRACKARIRSIGARQHC